MLARTSQHSPDTCERSCPVSSGTAQVSLSAYDERLSAGLFRRGSVGTILRLVPTMLSSDPTNDITVGSASLRVQLPEEVGRGQTALLTGDIVEATLVITVPEALAQKLSSLLLINATSHASEAVDIHDLLTALTKANEGKPQPLLPPLIESNQTVPQIPLVTRIARVMAATAKGGCKVRPVCVRVRGGGGVCTLVVR